MHIGQINFKGNNMLKLKDIIKEQGVADDDMKAAEKMRHDLEDAIGHIDKQMVVLIKDYLAIILQA